MTQENLIKEQIIVAEAENDSDNYTEPAETEENEIEDEEETDFEDSEDMSDEEEVEEGNEEAE